MYGIQCKNGADIVNLEAIKDLIKPALKRMPAYLKLAWALSKEPSLTTGQKALLAMGAFYAVSPVDLVPGFIPVVGQIDDIIVALGSLKMVLKGMPPEIAARYQAEYGLTIEEIDSDLDAAKQILAALLGKAVKLSAKGIYVTGRAGLGLLGRLVKQRKRKDKMD